MIRTDPFHLSIISVVFVVASLAWGTSDAVEPKRIWVDENGLYSIEARLIEIDDDQVVLLCDDGRRVTITIDKLSEEDKEYLEEVEQRSVEPSNPLRLNPPESPEIEPLPALDLAQAEGPAADGSTLAVMPASPAQQPTDPPAALTADPSPWTHEVAATRILMPGLDANADWSRPIPVTKTTEPATRESLLAMSISDRIRIPGRKSDNRLLRFDVDDRKVHTSLRQAGSIRLLDHHAGSGRSLVHLDFNSSGKGGRLAVADGWNDARLELSHPRKLSGSRATGGAHLRWARWVDDEHMIAVVDGKLALWNIVSGKQLYAINGIDHRAVPAISGGRRYIAVPSLGAVDLYATTTAQPLGRIEIENRIPGVAFSPQGDVLSIITSRRLRAWDLTSATLSADITCRRGFGDGPPIWIDNDLLLSSSGVLASLFRGLPIWRYDIAGTETVSIGRHIAMVRRHPTSELAIVSLPHAAAANAMRWMDTSPARVDREKWRILGQSVWTDEGWLDRDVQISARPQRLR